MSNHLAAEQSVYLLQHANQPVDWYPWGAEALALAKRLDKPIPLSTAPQGSCKPYPASCTSLLGILLLFNR